MGLIISFFRNFASLLGLVLTFTTSFSGSLVTVGASVASFFAFVKYDWFGWIGSVTTRISDLLEYIDPFMRALSYQDFFSSIYQGLALDTFSECVVYVFTLFIGIIGFTCFEIIFFTVSVVIPLLLLKSLRTLISFFTVGQVKP